MAFEVRDGDLFQPSISRIFALPDGELLLQREQLSTTKGTKDKVFSATVGDDVKLIAFNQYVGRVPLAHVYWWVIADRNDFLNPLENTKIVNGEEVGIEQGELNIPDILTERVNF